MPAALNHPAQTPASEMQTMLLRLPRDLITQISRLAPNRGRNQFVVEALQSEIERRKAESDAQIIAACEALNAYEAAHPEVVAESMEWVNAVLTKDDDDDFDPVEFERGWAAAKALREAQQVSA
jgi:predicted transcriptional regulator